MNLLNLVRSKYEKEQISYERRIRSYFYQSILKQNESVFNWIEQNGTQNIPYDILINPNLWTTPVIKSYIEIGLIAAKREYYFTRRLNGFLVKIDIAFLLDEWRQFLIQYAINYSYQIQNELSKTTREDIIKALTYAAENNITGSDLITYLRKKVNNQISKYRANLIARTESNSAANYAKELGSQSWIKESGQQGYKGWVTREDERVRHDHAVLDGSFITIDSLWNIGLEKAKRPGDVNLSAKERIQCRCTQVFITEDVYYRLLKMGRIKK